MNPSIHFRGIVENYLDKHPDACLYFLLDHAGLPGLKRILDHCAMQWTSLFDDTRESVALAAAPLLVTVMRRATTCPCLFLDWIAQHGAFSSAVTLLASPLPIDILRRRLVERLDIRLSENMQAMLRFFDPRILAQLRTTLTAAQAQAFFSVATRWWYVDRAGLLQSFDTAFAPGDGGVLPLVLDQEQEFALVDASEPDQVLCLLRSEVPNLLQVIAPSEHYGIVSASIDAARHAGLVSIQDFTIYVAAVLMKGKTAIREMFPKRASEDNVKNSEIFREIILSIEVGN